MKMKTKFFSPYTMVEVVFALGIFVLLSGSFYSVVSSMKKYRDKLELESEAVFVLDNLVQRISSERLPDREKASRILADEFSRSPLSSKEDVKALLKTEDGHAVAAIEKKGISVAKIKFGK